MDSKEVYRKMFFVALKSVLEFVIPILETYTKTDLNGNGKIG